MLRTFKQFIIEQSSRTLVLTFGRMNPPHIGHQKLVDAVKEIAQRNNADAKIFLSHTQDKKKNPLSYDQKILFTSAAFGDIIQKSNAKTIFNLLEELQNSYDKLIFVFGSDRLPEFESLINKYKGDYSFDSIEFESAGERDPDSDGVEGMSASKLRQFAVDGNLEEFKTGVPSTLNDEQATQLYNIIRNQMGVK